MWQIDLSPSDEDIRSILRQDRCWAAYALGDLRPPFRGRSTFYRASQGDLSAVVMVYRTTTFGALMPFGPVEGVAALLDAIPHLPDSTIISNCTDEQFHLLETYYTFSNTDAMYRMSITADSFQPFSGGAQTIDLSMDDIAEMSAFYTMVDVPAFSPDQLHGGVYRCVRRFGGLAAVGGTHFIDTEDRIAAVGNVYSDPAVRGQGFARTITSQVVAALFERGCTDVVLNVSKSNFYALRIYEQLGFQKYASFWEANARRKTG